MNRHLTSEQISAWAIGERSPQAESHLSGCPVCRADVDGLQSALKEFRGTVRGLGGELGSGFRIRALAPAKPGLSWRLSWKMLYWAPVPAAVALGLLMLLSPWQREEPRRGAEVAAIDAALLQQVNAEVSSTVPRPMEPLMKLVTWDGGSLADGKKDVSRHD